jgi:spore maturation protein CgeB
MAAFPNVHKTVEMTEEEIKYYGSDVSFVGAGYYNRRHFLSGLIDYDLKIWGTNWDMHSKLSNYIQRSGSRVGTDEIVRIYNSCRININLHSSSYHKGINPFGDFVNPRTFEIMSCGGFQLVDRRSGLNGLFEEGEEVVIFDDLNDLRQKIDHYLKHQDEAYRISENGKNRVITDHTYEKRMEEMLEIIVADRFEPAFWGNDRESVEELIREAGEKTELGEYLSHFADRERINLSDITKEISNGDGELSKTEALLLMMKEFTG